MRKKCFHFSLGGGAVDELGNAQERVKLNVLFRKRTNTVEVDFFQNN